MILIVTQNIDKINYMNRDNNTEIEVEQNNNDTYLNREVDMQSTDTNNTNRKIDQQVDETTNNQNKPDYRKLINS